MVGGPLDFQVLFGRNELFRLGGHTLCP